MDKDNNQIETHTCFDCGYVWLHGLTGEHDCQGRIKEQRDNYREATGNLAKLARISLEERDTLRAELEQAQKERDEAKTLATYKDQTATTFMNQVRRLQRELTSAQQEAARLRGTAINALNVAMQAVRTSTLNTTYHQRTINEALAALSPQPESEQASSPEIPDKWEPRCKTLLRSMLSALDRDDDETYLSCFEMLLEVHKELMPEQPAQQKDENPLWCAMCAKWTDHQSGSCPELQAAQQGNHSETPNSSSTGEDARMLDWLFDKASLEHHGYGRNYWTLPGVVFDQAGEIDLGDKKQEIRAAIRAAMQEAQL